MSSPLRIGPVLAAAVGAAWLVAAPPTRAAGDKADAREACKDVMGDRGMRNVEVDDVSKNRKGNVVVEADATKRGSDRSVDCVYNPDTENARIRK